MTEAHEEAKRAIAEKLVITDGAEKHVNSIFLKLGLAPADSDHRRVLAGLTYLRTRPQGDDHEETGLKPSPESKGSQHYRALYNLKPG